MQPQRFPNGIELRAVAEVRTAGRTLYGIAAPFNKPADILGIFSERILPGAFTATLSRQSDVLALLDHSGTVLGRTKSGTLRLQESAAGLEYNLDLPQTSAGNDVLELARRGDLGGISIGFTADSESWPDKSTRELRAVTLHEVSIVSTFPAYRDTSIALRSRALVQVSSDARRRWLAVL